MEYLSKERYEEIAAELHDLITVKLPFYRDEMVEARAQGDLSENFGYHAAKRMHGKTIGRIRYLQKVLEYSRVIDTKNLPKDKATLLSVVEFTNLATNTKMKYQLVSPHEMNLQEGKISIQSPIGEALMDKKEGEVVEVHAPAATFKLRIDKISF